MKTAGIIAEYNPFHKGHQYHIEETRKKTIEQIESDLHHAFVEYPLYRAWTSPRIRAKLRKRDGIHIMDIDEEKWKDFI